MSKFEYLDVDDSVTPEHLDEIWHRESLYNSLNRHISYFVSWTNSQLPWNKKNSSSRMFLLRNLFQATQMFVHDKSSYFTKNTSQTYRQ